MSRLKIVVNIITVLALLWLIYISRSQIHMTLLQLKELTWWLLILQLPVQFLSYGAVAHLYYSYFRNTATLGQLKLKEIYKISLELNFVNSVFPSGGVSGFSYLSLRLRPLGVNFASSTLAQSMRFAMTFISFLVILGIGLFLLAIDGKANDLVMLMGGSVFFLVIAGTGLFVFLINSQRRIKEFVAWLPKAINKLVQVIHYKSKKELIDIVKVERVLGEVHSGYIRLRRNKMALKKPFFYALAVNFFELLTIYLVYLAFGEMVNPGAVILAYAIANFAGLVAVLPGGVGVYEALMAAVLTVAGVDKALAISATLVYRVINLLVFIPIGLFFYHLAINKNKVKFDAHKSPQTSDSWLANLKISNQKTKSVKKVKKTKVVKKTRESKKTPDKDSRDLL